MAPSIPAVLQEAAQLHRQGRLPDAERLYRAALARQPQNFDALHLLGMLKMQQGRPAEAAELVSAAVKRKPDSGEALTLLGSILLTLHRVEEAIGCFDRVVAAQPRNADARFNRAVALAQAGRLPQALSGYDEVVAGAPHHGPAWFNRGNVLGQLGRYQEAVASYDRALALEPRSPDTLKNRGNALAALQRHDEALASFEQALTLRSDDIEALSNRANSLAALQRYAEALASCDRALAINPRHSNALVTCGNVLHAMGQYDRAIESYDRALSVAPSDVETINNRGISLLELGRFKDALDNAERAVALDPANAGAHHGRAKALQAVGRLEEAIRDYTKAIELQPDFSEAKWNVSTCYLCLGRFVEGWALYENRWVHDPTISLRPYMQPRWDGRPAAGTLLVWGDQGLGDQIIYAGLIPELAQYPGQLVLEVDARLVELYKRSFPEIEIIAIGSALHAGQVDVHEPLSSLPRYLRSSWQDFPRRERGYLVPPAERVTQLRERLTRDGCRVIGLSWVSRSPTIGQYKSSQLTDLASLLRLPGIRFVDLQYGDTAAEREAVEQALGVRVERLADIDNTNDIDGLAALIAACDAVFTVSNTTAHLAGAVGTPTWVMVPFGRGHLWYWFADRPDSPWYPRLKVRRQEAGESWSDLVARLAPEVAAALAR